MLGNIAWYSKSRKRLVRIGINGGKVCYDDVKVGMSPVSNDMRQAVLVAESQFIWALEHIFHNDSRVQGGQ